MLRDAVDLPQALASIRRRKPSAQPLSHQRQDLVRWWERRNR
jgi:hypothetical protein